MSQSDLLNKTTIDDLEDWWGREFLPEFHEKFDTYDANGNLQVAQLYVVLLDPAETHDWHVPLTNAIVLLSTNQEEALQPDGLRDNVVGKLAFSLRTGLPSSEAARQPHLLRRGDFPYAGADPEGGASGVSEEGDFWCYQQVKAKFEELLAEDGRQAISDSRNKSFAGARYMRVTYSDHH
jgi:hypothetical protein